ncbi:MAG: response regulator transcription factor [Caldilineales bacterium]|nr:response regulator transcription factor [Caldilineales bacterium]
MAAAPKARILIAEDEPALRNLLEISLSANGYHIYQANDGQDALDRLKAHSDIDLVILDIMMPRLDGFTVLKEIRKTSEVPVVILTALGSSEDMVKGFALGADDYITKPFTFLEVAARIEAILRRVRWLTQPAAPPTVFRAGHVVLDVEAHTVVVQGALCHMTPIEFSLLRYFMTHPNQVITKDDLFRDVWGYEFEGSTNLVEVAVRRLREKIELNPSDPQLIRTVRGVGYRFHPGPDTP